MRAIPGSSPPTFVFDDRAAAARVLADEIEAIVRSAPAPVLGLATGSTPIGTYQELVRRHRETGLSFARTTAFNLDEFAGLAPGHPHSFRAWIRENLGAHVDLQPDRMRFPDVHARDLVAAARAYEDEIRASGGIDLQLLGIGRNGHVGFNEPGAELDSRTREVELHAWTREDAAQQFGGLEHVPQRALTMGVATILDARRLRVLAFGARKAAIVRDTLQAPRDASVPSTWLRGHRDVRLYVDREAATLLERSSSSS